MNNVNLLSFNVRGLRDHKKRQEIFYWLKNLQNGKLCIHLLQETHSIESDLDSWRKEWGADIFLPHGDSRSRGIAFLLPENKDYKILSFKNVIEGRIACLDICIEGMVTSIINVYLPTKDKQADQTAAISKLETYLNNINPETLILGGDFNL